MKEKLLNIKLIKKRVMNNFTLKMIAFMIAVFMWLVVVNIDDPISTKVYNDIHVDVINDEVVTSNGMTYRIVDDTETITVSIRARRSVLSKLRMDDIHARADMKELTLNTQIPIEITLGRFAGRIEEITSKPGNLQVVIDEEDKATFPINPTATGSIKDGYQIQTLNAEPVQVQFRGPKQLIESIKRVVAIVDVSGLHETTKREAKMILYDDFENVIDQTMIENNLGGKDVTVEVVINRVKKLPVVIDESKLDIKRGYRLTDIKVAPVELRVVGTKKALSKIDVIEIPPEAVEAYGLDQSKEITLDIIPYLPSSIQLEDENANMVVLTITVEEPGTKICSVSTNSIQIENLDEMFEIDYGTTIDAEILVRGPEDTLSRLSLAQKVKMDLSSYTEPGSYEVPLIVELPDDCELVSDVSVFVTITEKEQREDL